MKKKVDLEKLINEFIEVWDCDNLIKFFEDVFPVVNLYDVDEHDDWVKDMVGEDNTENIRIIRTVYLMSKFCDMHASRIALTKTRFKDLWNRMEETDANV